jgi:hypothetical protein
VNQSSQSSVRKTAETARPQPFLVDSCNTQWPNFMAKHDDWGVDQGD